ncbi:MAG TPA: tripartite tricarboxylate transporter substrate binding protein [Burkholderiales bacterium]|jgi:tripartite-type tricarboxylate transporter receptor subunit TctC|nr:tripartite tricarboxylate transporter substrate binding protein [Burkholderiales bacterium]
MRTFIRILFFALISLHAAAQPYPTKPVHIVVPFPPSGAADLLTRALGKKLTDSWGQPVVADNRPGAGGNIGAEAAAKSAPDGYTLLMAAVTTHAVSMSLYSKLGYDLEKDLVPVSLVANVPHILVAHPSVPAKNLTEVIAWLKAQGGKANFASQGNGTLSHLEFELMKSMGGFSANHIPYKGSAPAMVDILAGNVVLLFDSIPSSLPQVRAGKLRGIAVASSRRSPVLPDLPTVSEAGLTGFAADSWFGIMAPAGTPRDIVAKLNADIQKGLESAEVKEIITRQGGEVMGSTPEQMAAQIKGDRQKWGRVVRESGAKIE